MRLTAITFPWGGGEDYTFDLPLGQIRALEEMTGVGAPVILFRLQQDQWKVDDFRETILQGLLGGGMQADKARQLVVKWVDNRPALESLIPAQTILLAWMKGAPQKKPEAAEGENETAEATAESTSLQSMESAPQSDSPQET